jgi:GT2 family glycosyltransferase
VTGCLSVVVTTCRRPERAIDCVRSVLACGDRDVEVIVVENRPEGSDSAHRLGFAFPDRSRVRVVHESRRGLSVARNTGLRHATGQYVAFLDDDVVVDPAWCRAVRRGFARGGDCQTGLIVPREIATASQALFDELTSFAKGTEERVYALDSATSSDPLFPFAAGAFGSGSNTTVRADVLRRLGGFRTALGAGTPARGGEDLDLFVRLIFAGHSLRYTPSAIVFHDHPRTAESLHRHAFDYGVGLTAMLCAQCVSGRHRELLRGVAAGARYFLSPDSRKNAARSESYPRRLRALEVLGMAWGPLAYLLSALPRGRDGAASLRDRTEG